MEMSLKKSKEYSLSTFGIKAMKEKFKGTKILLVVIGSRILKKIKKIIPYEV